MTTLTEAFRQAICNGMESLEQITDPYSRAMAAAGLATAIATTGIIKPETEIATSEEASTKATSRKTKAKQPEQAVGSAEAPVEPAPIAETAAEPAAEVPVAAQSESEWTEDMIALYKADYDQVNAWIEQYGIEAIDQWVSEFSDGRLTSAADITPQNIRTFITFLTTPLPESAAS